MDNIRYGRLDATDEEVKQAAKAVSADTVVEHLENGYDSDVGAVSYTHLEDRKVQQPKQQEAKKEN